MSAPKRESGLFRILLILTLLCILGQILLLYVSSLTNHLIDTFISDSITPQAFHAQIFYLGLVGFLAAQVFVYGVFICAIWYVAVSISELMHFSWRNTYSLGLLLWFVSVITIAVANTYFSPNSFFAMLVRDYLFYHTPVNDMLKMFMVCGAAILSLAILLAAVNLIRSFYQKENLLRHSIVVIFIGSILVLQVSQMLSARPHAYVADKPNIIIIGLDALRPDFIGYYQTNKTVQTKNIDAFLASSIQFTDATTTLARTFPSWASILTSTYPLHNHARGNNTNLNFIDVAETLPKQFQQAGYETIYATDDTRFNNTNKIFGFDDTVNPPMGLNDFIFGSINDFPLTNLIISTCVGKLLFPYNYANHGTAITYTPKNFLQLIQERLHQREPKPLFLAVHFTLSHWPFYWFNDKQPIKNSELQRYVASINAADLQLKEFFNILNQNKLLDHAIVILLSDHGSSFGLPGDRPITFPNYQGDPVNIKKIPMARYSNTLDNLNAKSDYHIDTSYGYGGDVLSMKQFHTLLAFRGYGVDIGKSHVVTDRVSLMDIAPTLLALAHLPALSQSDGISLMPYLSGSNSISENQSRKFFIETSFSLDALERDEISVSDVLQKALQLYEVDKKTGLISIKPKDEIAMNHDKQYGILQGDWLLAKYPASVRSKLNFSSKDPVVTFTQPPYFVLVNLKTGAWTTELDTPFARNSPAQSLLRELQIFYGDELNSFKNMAKTPSTQLIH